jgi:hypothetical protein
VTAGRRPHITAANPYWIQAGPMAARAKSTPSAFSLQSECSAAAACSCRSLHLSGAQGAGPVGSGEGRGYPKGPSHGVPTAKNVTGSHVLVACVLKLLACQQHREQLMQPARSKQPQGVTPGVASGGCVTTALGQYGEDTCGGGGVCAACCC